LGSSERRVLPAWLTVIESSEPSRVVLVGAFGSSAYGHAAYVAFVVGAALWPRGIVWILGIALCAVGAVVFLLAAIHIPGDTIRWLFAGAYSIEALALFALGNADRYSRDLCPWSPAHSEHPPADRQ
jgi:hypothetical protein